MSKLVIVESPAKAKTIKKYLGSDFDVVASMGHVRDLPENRLSVDVKKDFKPKYEVIKGKEKLVEELKEAADKIGFPCVVKPLMSSSGKGQSLVKLSLIHISEPTRPY